MTALEEYSCYNDTIQSLTEIAEFQSVNYGKIRVLHCENLTSMQGIENQHDLLELNLSSNALQRIEGLHNMNQLQVLNLSCNNIRVINCLSGLYNLQKLNLSFNKISSLNNLRQLYGPDYTYFSVFDIRGNNISVLTEVKFLSGCVYLTDVALSGTSGTNPVCSQPEYFYTVLKALPGIKFLDQKPVNALNKDLSTNKEIRKIPEKEPKKFTEKEPKQHPEREQKLTAEKESETSFDLDKENSKDKELEQKVKESKKLENDLAELYTAYKELSYKFRNSEEYWSMSCKKLEEQNSKLNINNKDLDVECKRLRRKLVAKEKKVSELKSRINSIPPPNPVKEKAFEDIHIQIGNLMKDLGESQRTAQQAVDEVYKKQEKLKILEKKNYEQKAEMKKLESLLKDVHNKSVESSQQAFKRYEELQVKFQESQSVVVSKDLEIESLKQKYMEILDLNSKFDENWSQKYREAIHSRESQISALREELSKFTLNEKSKTQELIFSEKEENRSKIWELEQKVMNLTIEYQEKLRMNENKFSDLMRENSDLKEMLKLSIEKEVKSKNCIDELADLIKQLQIQLDKEISEKMMLKKNQEDHKKELETESVTWKTKYDSLKTRLEIIEKDAYMGEDTLHIKNREIAKLKREQADQELTVEDLEEKLKTLKFKMEKNSSALNIEIEDLQDQVKELELTIGTKNAIIEDQNDSIKELKGLISQYEQEIDNFNNKKNSHKENYEKKLVEAYDEIETLKTKLSNTENILGDIENQVMEIQSKKNEYEEEVADLQKQVKEKNEVLEYVEAEIANMKKEKDLEIAEVAREKEVIISDLKRFRDELTNKSMSQERDLKEKQAKIKELENDLGVIARELQAETKKSEKMQAEIKVLLTEMDNQKRLANEKISQLQKMFT